MIICRGCLFIHIPKTAGASIGASLRATNQSVYLWTSPRAYDPHLPPDWIRGVLGRKWFAVLWKFAFVRNPWDRLVSLYFYKRERHNLPQSGMEFLPFVRWSLQNNIRQERFLRDLQLYDFIGRFEQLAVDWPIVAEKLGLCGELPNINTSPHGPYQDYYDEEHRQLVASCEPTLLEKFNYRFES